jgi:glycosyltransferase involved in cell wall biosynthesis
VGKKQRTMQAPDQRPAEPRPPRLLFLISSLGMGGAETQVVQLALRFREQGWAVTIVSLTDQNVFSRELADAAIPALTLGLRNGRGALRGLAQLARIAARFQPDVLHAHMVHANLMARLLRVFRRVPVVVCTAHNVDEGGRIREIGYRLTDRLCDLTTQVSELGLNRYREIGAVSEGRSRFMPNGVELGRFRFEPARREELRSRLGCTAGFAWLAVGRFQAQKDYPNMIEAFARTAPGAGHLFLAGAGPDRAAIEDMVRARGLTDRFTFLGMRRDIDDLMRAVDGFVLSSAWEGMPMVLLEAAASGLPVVATDVGGNASLVEHGVTGLLVPPRNPAALAEAVERISSLPADALDEMRQKARAHIAVRYSLESVARQWAALYEQLFDRKDLRATAGRPLFAMDADLGAGTTAVQAPRSVA